MKISQNQALIIALIVLAVLWYLKKQAGDAVAAVGTAVNPTSDQNLAYRGVNGVGQAISGDDDWSLGSWMYDVMNPDQMEAFD